MTRNGKIARLPRYLRDNLNCRLQDGEPGRNLVVWLNSLQAVQDVMEDFFNGVPISEQNLSEWKQGGFLDWQKHEESLEWVRQVTEQADDLSDEAGLVPLSDRLSGIVALTLGRLLQRAAEKPLEEESVREEILSLSRELALLRREDHEAARLKMELEIHARKQADQVARDDAREKHREEWGQLNKFIKATSMEAVFRNATSHVPPELIPEFREALGMTPLASRLKPPAADGKELNSDPAQSK
jgi:hypothetical protein